MKKGDKQADKKEMLEDANRLASLTGELAGIYKDLKEGKKEDAEKRMKNILLEAEGFMSAIEAIGSKGEFSKQVQELGNGFNFVAKEIEGKSEAANKVNQDIQSFLKNLEDFVSKLKH